MTEPQFNFSDTLPGSHEWSIGSKYTFNKEKNSWHLVSVAVSGMQWVKLLVTEAYIGQVCTLMVTVGCVMLTLSGRVSTRQIVHYIARTHTLPEFAYSQWVNFQGSETTRPKAEWFMGPAGGWVWNYTNVYGFLFLSHDPWGWNRWVLGDWAIPNTLFLPWFDTGHGIKDILSSKPSFLCANNRYTHWLRQGLFEGHSFILHACRSPACTHVSQKVFYLM